MFAGEGTPERTNRRFHYLSLGQPAARLSDIEKTGLAHSLFAGRPPPPGRKAAAAFF